MWTADLGTARYIANNFRDKLRYPSDLTDAECCGRISSRGCDLSAIPPKGKPGGGKRRVDIREVINGVMSILGTGCQWRAAAQGFAAQKHRA